MKTFTSITASILTAAGVMALASAPASALTVQECSAKYKAAKAANTLAGKSWNDFRKSDCGDATPAADAKPAAAPAAKPAAPAAAAKPAAPAAAKAAAPGGAVFPKAVDPKYATENPAKQRMHTCLDQYKANKVANTNGGLKWIQKGGGYYSECNKALKG